MRWLTTGLLLTGLVIAAGCNKRPATSSSGPQATVLLKDGTSFAGTVTQSSTSQITLTAPNGEARTYPMTQVDSVQYLSVPPAAASSPAAPVATGSPTPATPPVSPSPLASQSAPPAPALLAQSPAPPSSPAAPAEVERVIPAGRQLAVRNNDLIDSRSASAGQFYSAVIARDVRDRDGVVLIPRGSDARLVVRSVRAQGKVEGQSELALDLDSVVVAGRRYRVETPAIVEKGHQGLGKNARTAKFVGGATVLGTILGAVAGGGRGAAIGAVSGAAAGTATQAVTRGKGVRVPAETVLTFRLEAPVSIREYR